jgi:uncharacterized protein
VSTFVDTSALYALLDADDDNHHAAATWFRHDGIAETSFLTHSYVVVETAALVHHRLGMRAVRELVDGLVPAVNVVHVEAELHARAVAAYLGGLSRRVSFVDRVSFQMMRDDQIERAFAFDSDFRSEGFSVVPS